MFARSGAEGKPCKHINTSPRSTGVTERGRITHPLNPSTFSDWSYSLSTGRQWWLALKNVMVIYGGWFVFYHQQNLIVGTQNLKPRCKNPRRGFRRNIMCLIQNQSETEDLSPAPVSICLNTIDTWCRIYANEPIPWWIKRRSTWSLNWGSSVHWQALARFWC